MTVTEVNVSLGPAAVNLLGIVENDDWAIALTLTTGVDPYDLTGATVTAKIKPTTGTSYTLTTVITDDVGGQLTVSQSGAPLITSGAKWSLRINARTIMSGSVNGTADVLA